LGFVGGGGGGVGGGGVFGWGGGGGFLVGGVGWGLFFWVHGKTSKAALRKRLDYPRGDKANPTEYRFQGG